MSKPTASRSAADSVQAPVAPLGALLTAVVQTFDLKAWCGITTDPVVQHGRYITITAETDDVYYIFGAATAPTITPGAVSLDSAAPAAGACMFIAAGTSRDHIIDPAYPFLGVRAKVASGVGYCRVARS